jgi:hypothetical protein
MADAPLTKKAPYKPYEEAAKLLMWDSNRTALWELNERLSGVERS